MKLYVQPIVHYVASTKIQLCHIFQFYGLKHKDVIYNMFQYQHANDLILLQRLDFINIFVDKNKNNLMKLSKSKALKKNFRT